MDSTYTYKVIKERQIKPKKITTKNPKNINETKNNCRLKAKNKFKPISKFPSTKASQIII